MSLVPKKGKEAPPFWLPYVKWGGFIFLTLSSLIQCTNSSQTNYRLSKLETRPTTVSFGRNAHVTMGKALTPEENAIEFLQELMPMSHSISSKISKDLNPKCKKDPKCLEAKDSGVKVQGIHVPSLVAIASNAVVPSYQKAFLSALMKNCERWKSGDSCLYQVLNVEPMESKEGLKFKIDGAYYNWGADGARLEAYEHDVVVNLKSVLPPKPKSNLTIAQETIATALSRGYMITMVEPI